MGGSITQRYASQCPISVLTASSSSLRRRPFFFSVFFFSSSFFLPARTERERECEYMTCSYPRTAQHRATFRRSSASSSSSACCSPIRRRPFPLHGDRSCYTWLRRDDRSIRHRPPEPSSSRSRISRRDQLDVSSAKTIASASVAFAPRANRRRCATVDRRKNGHSATSAICPGDRRSR